MSSCWLLAGRRVMKVVAGKMKVRFPDGAVIDADVDLCSTGDDYFLKAGLNISLPGLDSEVARTLVDVAHQN